MFVEVKLKEIDAENIIKEQDIMKMFNTALTLTAILTPGQRPNAKHCYFK